MWAVAYRPGRYNREDESLSLSPLVTTFGYVQAFRDFQHTNTDEGDKNADFPARLSWLPVSWQPQAFSPASISFSFYLRVPLA